MVSGQVCTGPNVIAEPEQFVWKSVDGDEPHYTGTMEIVEADLTVGGESIHTRIYRQGASPDDTDEPVNSIPGPTLFMKPGHKYVLQFRNRLPYEPRSTQHNVFKDPNVSNLHTHGLHMSGMSPGDDVTRSFEGQSGGDFVYNIPADHMGGTYWYHAHHHGSTYLQVSGGAFGMIVIDDSGDNIPSSVAEMEERQLVVAYLDPNVAGIGGDTLISGTLAPTWTVNGKVNGDLCMPPDTWQHWRILLADREAWSKTVSIGANCELALMARDGVWRTEVPKELSTNSISLTGASRADLAVRCKGNADISVAGELVAKVVVDPDLPINPGAGPYDGEISWYSKRPGYLRDLRNLDALNPRTIVMGGRTVNGKNYNPGVPTFTMDADGVKQFHLEGATNHPFHLHIYHLQVQGDCGEYEDGEYYDVVSGDCTVKFDLSPETSTPYEGRTIMHCHILEHEDQGAMGWVNVIGGAPAPSFPLGFGYDDYIEPGSAQAQFPAAPSGLLVTAVASHRVDLRWTDNSDNETLFTIERSDDGGSSFNFLDTAEGDTTHYSDTDVSADTSYHYQVRASNSWGNSAYSNRDNATTPAAFVASALATDAITVSTVGVGGGKKQGRAVVTVKDDTGNPVPGAIVHGQFSGGFTGPVITSDPTDVAGMTVFDSAETVHIMVPVFFEFCVLEITLEGLEPFSVSPGAVCSRWTDDIKQRRNWRH